MKGESKVYEVRACPLPQQHPLGTTTIKEFPSLAEALAYRHDTLPATNAIITLRYQGYRSLAG